MHRKGTRRTPPPPTLAATVMKPSSQSYEWNFPSLPSVPTPSPVRQPVIDPNQHSSFLGVLQQIQQQLNALQATQQTQAAMMQDLTKSNINNQYQHAEQNFPNAPSSVTPTVLGQGYQIIPRAPPGQFVQA